MKNKKLTILGIIVVIILIITIISLFFLSKRNKPEEIDMNTYTIHYYYRFYIYDMVSYHNKITVNKNEQVQCITSPCNPILLEEYSITNKDKYRNKFIELVGDKKEINLTNEEIDKDTRKIFSEILKEEIDSNDKEIVGYKELGPGDNQEYSTRGYYVEEKDGKVIVTLAMGEKNTGGYGISLVRVNMIDDGAQIYFEEKQPSEKDVVTEAFTYPITQIEFDKMPKYIKAQSLDNYEELTRVGE